MVMDILGIADSALSAFQTGVAISSKNIANSANTDYSRELAEFSSSSSGDLSVSIQRISDDFLASQLNSSSSSMSEHEATSRALNSVDQFITGLNGSDSDGPYNMISHNIQSFFDSLNNLSATQTSATKTAVIDNATTMISTFQNTSRFLKEQEENASSGIRDSITEINSLTKQIAKLNIKLDQFSGEPSPDLLDQRDSLVRKLSGFVGVKVTLVGNIANINLLKNGSSLVTGGDSAQIGEIADEFGDKKQITIGGTVLKNTSDFTGKLGGFLKIYNDYLPEIKNKLNLFSTTLMNEYNKNNRSGYLDDSTQAAPKQGGDIFSPDYSTDSSYYIHAVESNKNTGNAEIGVQIDDASKLKPTSYTLTEISSGTYRIVDDKSGASETFSSFPFTTSDGIKISQLSGSSNVGDSFRINAVADASQSSVSATADQIAISSKVDGTGNGNIVALADLANKNIFENGTNDFSQEISSIFAKIGSMSSGENELFESSKITNTQASNDKQSLSGVNTQEEYTNIIHFQQSYTAASKIISTDQKMFSDIVSMLGE